MSQIQDPTPHDPATALASPAPAAPADTLAAATTPTAQPEDAPETFDARDVLTLAQLVQRHGIATPEEVGFYLEGANLQRLAADGADVATPRITRDGARMFGTISGFVAHATPAQRALVPAITDDYLRVAIWSLYHGQGLYAARQAVQQEVATVRTGRTANTDDLRLRASGYRDVLHSGLLILAGQKSDLRSQIERVYNQNSLPALVASSLRGLVKIGREVLADTSPAALQRRRGSQIDERFLATCETLAAQVETLGEVAGALSARPPVLQEEVDLWDGRNLAFIDLAIGAFEAGRTLDPSLPRIFPIALRSFFNRRTPASKAEPPPSSPSPTPPPSNAR